jgi:hypothetical protein
VLGVELVVSQTQQELLDSGQSLTCFVGKFFERDQRTSPSGNPDSDIVRINTDEVPRVWNCTD